ncbi:histone-lysine N-methyltransferase SETMAR [Trichonephila clavipes]|nr:histone-lysine N-methyltransferase SETMAR [Trichonephila clavipes]
MAKIHELQFELLDHPPYSPDLAPSDFFLLPHLKIVLEGQRNSSNEEAITFVNHYFVEKNVEYYLDGYRVGSFTGRSVQRYKDTMLKNKKKFRKNVLLSC